VKSQFNHLASVKLAMKQLRSSLLFVFVSCIMPLATLAQTGSLDLNSAIPFDAKVRTGKLANGLTYYIRQNGKPEHRAELRIVIRAGSVLEDNDQQGLAHFNEHMSFNGTKNYPHNTLESFLESHGARFGADLNAYTSFDETVYKLSLPTDQGAGLDSGIEILSEWAHNDSFDSVEFEKERGVVDEEWRMGRGAQERIQNKEFPVLLYGSKYAERNPIGLKAVIDTAHRSAILRFYHDWYRPDLMAVIAVGDFDPAKVEQKIKDLFGPIQNPENERPRPTIEVPPHQETLVSVCTDKELPQVVFQMLFKRPVTDEVTVKDYRHNMIISLYDQMLNARIQEMLQKGTAPFAYGGAQDSRFIGDVQAYSVFAILRQDSVKQGVASILREVYRAEQTGFSASELDRAKKEMMSSTEKAWGEKAKTNNGNYVQEYLSNFLQKEPSPGIDYEYNLNKQYLPGITVSEVNAVSTELLEHTSRVMAFAGPDSTVLLPPSKDQLLSILSNIEHERLAAYEDKTSNAPLMKTAPKSGQIVEEKTLADLGVTIWQLSNGARVIVKPTDFKDDEILFRATAPGGSSVAPDQDYLSANNANDVVENSGLADFDATDLQKVLAGKEVEISPYISDLQQGFSGHSTKKDLETLFQLANLYMTQPRYDSGAAASYFSRMAAFLDNRTKQPESAFQDTLEVTLAQHNYRAQPMTTERLKEINLPKAYNYYKSLFTDAGGYTFYFVGNINPKTLRPLVEQYLASLPSSATHASWKDVGIRAPKGVVVKKVYKGTDPKSIVSLVFTGKAKFSREDRFKIAAMSQAFEIKLREDIREDKSGVYYVGVRPSFEKYPRGQYKITIQFGCNPTRVDELVGEVLKQIDTLTSKPIENTYVERVHNILKNELETNMKENNYWMAKLQDAFWNDIDPATILEGANLIDSFTPNDAFEAAKQYFDLKNYVQVVLYPEKKS
jgi:zinc protease